MAHLRILAASLILGTWALITDAGAEERSRFEIELEGGPVWQNRNDVQIPNDETGTRFALDELVDGGPWESGRLTVTWSVAERHGVELVLAPLEITESVRSSQPIDFDGESFAAGVATEATYRFDSWRLGYRYRFHDGDHWAAWVGITAKIRDAEIALAQRGLSASKTDLGFVPLLHFAVTWKMHDRWSADLKSDALAGGPGRAIDASVKLRHHLTDRWSLALGYRTIEGGADVDEVYNFAWLHYAVASVGVGF